METWMPIEDAPLYEVSDLGNVRHVRHKKNRKLHLNRGYCTTRLNIYGNKSGNKQKTHYVARLVYFSFNPEKDRNFQVDHINRVKSDNRLENLRVVTPLENNSNKIYDPKILALYRIREICKLYDEGMSALDIYNSFAQG